jgi:phage portal protein BeeE
MSILRGLQRLLSGSRENPAWPAVYSELAGMAGTQYASPMDQDFKKHVESHVAFPTMAAAMNKMVALADTVKIYQADRKTRDRLDAPRLVNRNGEDLLQSPNPGEGAKYFRQKSLQQLGLTGNLYQVASPNMQSPNELWLAESQYMKPKLSASDQYPFDSFTYFGQRQKIHIPADQVVFTRRPHPRDRVYGLSFPRECADSLELLWRSRELNKALLRRGGRTGGFLQIKGGLGKPEQKRIRQQIESRFTVDGSGKVVVIGAEDATFTPDLTPMRDLEHATTITEAKLEVYNVFGFMPALFSTRDVNRSNLREAKASAYEDSVVPFMELWLEQLNASPMCIAAGIVFVADWSAVPALQPNKLEMARAADVLLKHGVATPNEIAGWFGLEEKEWGEEPSKAGMSMVVEAPDEEEDEDPDGDAGNGNGNGRGGSPSGLDLMAPDRALRILEKYHGVPAGVSEAAGVL